ncbi:FkbM family methyltransferase [Synechocystis sp. PCC 7339]|uniref:FkbM family methyltransferase n=1 Tax=unclassified Synechocystis TaxID=2640012 RepID=UPI001BB07E50|nr:MULTISPECIES: FkbM family methyltransferase [unclassified Synechocystis]QUS62001.1 FkbM family methyltransferase [Synechocystis sp. PCC 7338]UAJ74198.1 FkbM family methyltransferase [Synechocystis sp. PCC 7339]
MFNKIKDKLKFKLAKVLAPEIDKKLAIEEKLSSINLFGIAPWYQENLWEPPVQIVLRDLCKPGDIVFDVGANFAGLTTVMSRMVGPRGVVCAFEASPRIIDKTQRNLVLSGCNNVQLFHHAVYSTSHETVKIYLGSHLNDSIYSENGVGSTYEVKTIALDDFVEHTKLVPNLLKMDIEGAEFDAIKGMEKTLVAAKPHLVLETQRNDTRCLDFLRNLGYIAIDVNTYREVKTADDYPVGADIRNNLYIHGDRLGETPYHDPFQFESHSLLDADHFKQTKDGSVCLKSNLLLPKGRYLIDWDFTAEGTQNDLMCGVKVNDKVIFRYHAFSQLLASSYRDWVINLPETSEIQLYFEFQHGTQDPTLTINSAKITKIANFDHLPAALYF